MIEEVKDRRSSISGLSGLGTMSFISYSGKYYGDPNAEENQRLVFVFLSGNYFITEYLSLGLLTSLNSRIIGDFDYLDISFGPKVQFFITSLFNIKKDFSSLIPIYVGMSYLVNYSERIQQGQGPSNNWRGNSILYSLGFINLLKDHAGINLEISYSNDKFTIDKKEISGKRIIMSAGISILL